jgi:transcriptional regulator with XRE-family HTH domain
VDLRTLRDLKEWSQQELAAAAGIPSQTTISQLERGVIGVKLDVAKRLAKALGVSLDTLEHALNASRKRHPHEHPTP